MRVSAGEGPGRSAATPAFAAEMKATGEIVDGGAVRYSASGPGEPARLRLPPLVGTVHAAISNLGMAAEPRYGKGQVEAVAAVRFLDGPVEQTVGVRDPLLQSGMMHEHRGRSGAQAGAGRLGCPRGAVTRPGRSAE
jgi:hypothetical protein